MGYLWARWVIFNDVWFTDNVFFLSFGNMMLFEYSILKGPILWILDVGEKEHFSTSASMLGNHTVNGIM